MKMSKYLEFREHKSILKKGYDVWNRDYGTLGSMEWVYKQGKFNYYFYPYSNFFWYNNIALREIVIFLERLNRSEEQKDYDEISNNWKKRFKQICRIRDFMKRLNKEHKERIKRERNINDRLE